MMSTLCVSCERADVYELMGRSVSKTKIVVADYQAGGYIWISYDGGSSWVKKGPPNGWSVVHSTADGLRLVAAPIDALHIGYLYISVDGGDSWEPRLVNVGTTNWSTITSSEDGSIVFATSYSPATPIFRSVNYGYTWAVTTIAPNFWSCIVSSSDGKRLEASESGSSGNLIWTYTTVDNVTWNLTAHTLPASSQYSSVGASADGQVLITVGNSGYICTSANGGSTWNQALVVGTGYWLSVTASLDGTKLTAADNANYTLGNLWSSLDSGATWTAAGVGPKCWRKVAATPDGMYLAAGVNGGSIFTSSDGGVTWIERNNIYAVGNAIAITRY